MNKLFSTIMSVCLACNVQATDLFKTSQDIALRAPSVPLITSDTYLAIWSPYNELNEGNTEHWTAATHPLLGALRVDGKVYRFMGKDRVPRLKFSRSCLTDRKSTRLNSSHVR